jgi:hypothetical protein
VDVRFDTGDATGPALRVDLRGRDGGVTGEAFLHFATLRPVNFDAFWAGRGWIDAATRIGVASLTARDWLRVGTQGADVLLSRGGEGPAAVRTVVTGGLEGARLSVTPQAGTTPVIVLNGKRK